MKWTRLTSDNIPDKKALALGYQKAMLVGYIYADPDVEFICEGQEAELTEVSHFILVEDLLKLLAE